MNLAKMSFSDLNKELSEEELFELENAEKREPEFDEDAP